MVKKLFKHEMLAYLRVMLLVYGILIGVAALSRFVQFFENDSTIYNIVFGSSVLAYVVAMVAALGAAVVFGVMRFYKNLFTAEGYLTFTLPVTATQHLTVKMVTAAMFQLLTLVVMALSLCVITAGDVLVEIVRAVVYFFHLVYAEVGWHIVGYGVEFLLLMVIASFTGYLLYYTCISLGQMAKKNRVLAAVGIYFAYYMITQFVSTILIAVFSLAAEFLNLDPLFELIIDYPCECIHVFFAAMILLTALMATVYYCITRWVMRRRLNLE